MSNIFKEIDNALEKHDGKLPVVEIFYSIEGEGKRAGFPTVFIRLAGCNLRCKYCFGANTRVNTSNGYKKISELKIGDSVFSWDGEKVVEDKVINVFKRKVSRDEMRRLVVDLGGNRSKIYVTKNHPFYVKGEWRSVDSLSVGDEIYYFDYNAWRMKYRNPMQNKEIAERVATKRNGVKIKEISELTEKQMARLGTKNECYVYNIETQNHNYFVHGLLCHNCDTQYALDLDSPEIFWMDIDEIVSEVMKYKCENVTITGGEPLLYRIYIARMIKYMTHLKPDIEVNIETNGTITPLDVLMNMENVFITADQKCPCSGYDEVVPYLSDLREKDVLKFVVADEVDLAFVKKVLIEHQVKAQIFMHPVFGADLQKLAEFIKQNDYLNIRLGIQLHKVIWKPNERWV